MSKKVSLHIRLSPELYAQLESHAEKHHGGNISAAVRDGIAGLGKQQCEELYDHADIDEPARNILARFGWFARGGGDD